MFCFTMTRRFHILFLLVLALATGWITAELALVAAYYNLRWIARYALVARRWGASS